MQLQTLRAGWRNEYINAPRETSDHDCIFCLYPGRDNDRDDLLLHRGEDCYVLMNRYPYTTAHLMVIPYLHTNRLSDLPSSTTAEMMQLCSKTTEVLNDVYHPNGFNIGMNIGEAGGAGIAEHLHLHIVPRWNGDTNFISIFAETRVLPETLLSTYDKLAERWKTKD